MCRHNWRRSEDSLGIHIEVAQRARGLKNVWALESGEPLDLKFTYFDGKVWNNKLAKQFAVDALPMTWLLGVDGRVIATHLRGEGLEEAVKAALEGQQGEAGIDHHQVSG